MARIVGVAGQGELPLRHGIGAAYAVGPPHQHLPDRGQDLVAGAGIVPHLGMAPGLVARPLVKVHAERAVIGQGHLLPLRLQVRLVDVRERDGRIRLDVAEGAGHGGDHARHKLVQCVVEHGLGIDGVGQAVAGDAIQHVVPGAGVGRPLEGRRAGRLLGRGLGRPRPAIAEDPPVRRPAPTPESRITPQGLGGCLQVVKVLGRLAGVEARAAQRQARVVAHQDRHLPDPLRAVTGQGLEQGRQGVELFRRHGQRVGRQRFGIGIDFGPRRSQGEGAHFAGVPQPVDHHIEAQTAVALEPGRGDVRGVPHVGLGISLAVVAVDHRPQPGGLQARPQPHRLTDASQTLAAHAQPISARPQAGAERFGQRETQLLDGRVEAGRAHRDGVKRRARSRFPPLAPNPCGS